MISLSLWEGFLNEITTGLIGVSATPLLLLACTRHHNVSRTQIQAQQVFLSAFKTPASLTLVVYDGSKIIISSINVDTKIYYCASWHVAAAMHEMNGASQTGRQIRYLRARS